MDNKTVKQLIGKFDKTELQDLICCLVGRNSLAQQDLLDYCQKNSADKKSANYGLIIENQIKQYWLDASKIIEVFDMYGGGPEEDEDYAYEELERLEQLFEDNQVSWEFRKELLEDMLGFVVSDNSGFTDRLVDLALMMCTTKEEEIYLADYLTEHVDGYYHDLAAKIYLDNGENAKFLANKKANLQYGSDYLELADYYKKHGDEELALKIVQEGFHKADGRLDEIYKYLFLHYEQNKDEKALEQLYRDSAKKEMNQDTITELMSHYYKKKGDYEKQKAALLKLVSLCDGDKLSRLYKRCSQELTEEDFSKREQAILNKIKERNPSGYLDILLEKNEAKEVMDYIMQHLRCGGVGLDEGHYFTKRLAARYPGKVVELYWREVDSYVKMGKEQNYRRAVSVLKDVRRIMIDNHWQDEWENRYRVFLQEHRRKRLLLKELEGFGE